jgi:hypothetical protein
MLVLPASLPLRLDSANFRFEIKLIPNCRVNYEEFWEILDKVLLGKRFDSVEQHFSAGNLSLST